MPHRRCVGCGRIAPKPELVRIATVGEPARRSRRAVLDTAGTLPGRGAYLCRGPAAEPAAECLAIAVRRGSIARALRCAVTLTLDEPGASAKLVESGSR